MGRQRNNFGYVEESGVVPIVGSKFLRQMGRALLLLTWLVITVVLAHYINSFWPPEKVVIVSNQSTLPVVPAPVPTVAPTPTSKPLTLEQKFQPYADKICATMSHDAGFVPPPDVVQRIEIQDDKTTAYVYCMRPSDHNVNGPYPIGL